MEKLEEIRVKIGACDDIIIEQLAKRMSCIQEIIAYKKATGIPIFLPVHRSASSPAPAVKSVSRLLSYRQ